MIVSRQARQERQGSTQKELPHLVSHSFFALQRRNILFSWQERPKERRIIEPKKTKEDAKKSKEAGRCSCPFFRFFSFLSANMVLVAAEGRAAVLAALREA
jgi:hypothetical protein